MRAPSRAAAGALDESLRDLAALCRARPRPQGVRERASPVGADTRHAEPLVRCRCNNGRDAAEVREERTCRDRRDPGNRGQDGLACLDYRSLRPLHVGRAVAADILRASSGRHSDRVDEEQGIYRGEVLAIMIALADIHANTRAILAILDSDEEDDEAEEVDS